MVLGTNDLNKNQSLRQTYGVSGEKVVCCGLCKSDPITVDFSVLKQGYVPGECIVFNANIDNKSNRDVKDVAVDLYQLIHFHATTKTYTERRSVAKIKYPNSIAAQAQAKWDNSVLLIPSVCSSSNGTCKIIVVEYQLVLKFSVSGAMSKELKIPITIGTVPLSYEPLNYPFTYEGDTLAPNTLFDNAKEEDKGEIVDTNNNVYKPVYPYYKDISLINKK